MSGATGAVGGRVAVRLGARGLAQRLIVRDAARAPRLEGAEIAEVDGYHDRGAMTEALRGADAFLLVSAREAADRVAVAVLTGEDHNGQTYDLTGPEALTLADAAALLSEAAGRPVTYVNESLEEAYASRSSYGAPRFEVDGWVTSYAAVATGEMDVVSDAVPRLTGHPAQSLREYLSAHPDSYSHLTKEHRQWT